jgi:hypothetical protein
MVNVAVRSLQKSCFSVVKVLLKRRCCFAARAYDSNINAFFTSFVNGKKWILTWRYLVRELWVLVSTSWPSARSPVSRRIAFPGRVDTEL